MTSLNYIRFCKGFPVCLLLLVLWSVGSVFGQEPSPLFNTANLVTGFEQGVKNDITTDNINGAFNYSYGITIPPGRNGFQPDLKLTYNNQHADLIPNIVGCGWNVDIPFISRINKSGTEKLYTDDYFFSSLSGELVLVSGATYAPKCKFRSI